MNKRLLTLFGAMLLAFNTTICYAAPIGTYKPSYTPVSQSSWYQSLQNALKNIQIKPITVTIPKQDKPTEETTTLPPKEETKPTVEEKPIEVIVEAKDEVKDEAKDDSFELIKPTSGKMNDFFYSEAKTIGLDKKMSDREAYTIISNYVVDYMTYSYTVSQLTNSNYTNRKGNCNAYCQLAELFCKMRGIPIEIYAGTQKENDWSTAHVWNRVKIDGKWYWSDLTYYQNKVSGSMLFEKGSITMYERGHLNVIYDRNFRKIGTLDEAMNKMEW